MQAEPKTGILIQLFGPGLGIIRDLGVHYTSIAGPFGWRRVSVDNRLDDPLGAQNSSGPQRQDSGRHSALGFVRIRNRTASNFELRNMMFEDARRNWNHSSDVAPS